MNLGIAIAIAISAAVGRADEPPAAVSPQGRDIAGLAWLAGCWELRSGARMVEEQWTSPRGGLMLGASRAVRNDSLIEFEQVRIEQRGTDLIYVASPSRQATAEFKATALDASSVVFENPAHDFPKKIFYRRQGADSLVAGIEGPRGGTSRSINYPYKRVRCPGS
jgi:hypothetical protein